MDFETWVDMVRKEFYTIPWVINCINSHSITRERFEKYLQEEKDTISSMYENEKREWERRKNEFISEGYDVEKFTKDSAIGKANCLYLMYHD